MRGYKIFSGSANVEFARQVSKYLSLPLSDAGVKRFSDGEIAFKLMRVYAERMFLLFKVLALLQTII